MSKVTALCMISLLLFLTLSHSFARPMAAFHDVTPIETHHAEKQLQAEGEEGYSCEGLEEEECMMRRTLQAHLDYIYTQKGKQP